MWCSKCQKDLSECTCDDIEERLSQVSNPAYRACALCGMHYSRCKCKNPVWVLHGKEKS